MKRLVIPLLIVLLISLVSHFVISNDSFFINLTTELIGIIITIVYVDWIIKSNEKQLWEDAERRISSRIRLFINLSITNTRVSLGYKTDIFDYDKLSMNNVKVMNLELLRITKEVLEPTLKTRINSFNPDDWLLFSNNIHIIRQEAEKLLSIFGGKLSPKQFTLLIDIQDLVRSSLSLYSVFPDIAGVPDEKLPKAKISTPLLKEEINNSTSKSLRELLLKVRELAETISGDA